MACFMVYFPAKFCVHGFYFRKKQYVRDFLRMRSPVVLNKNKKTEAIFPPPPPISLIHIDTYSDLLASWLEHQTRDRKVASLNPGRSSRRIFFSRVNFVCRLLFSVRSNPVIQQWHVKDPGHSAKSAGGRLHLNTHTSLTQQSWSGLTRPLARHSVGNYQETSSHTSHQRTLDHSRLSLLSHYGPILAERVELVCTS